MGNAIQLWIELKGVSGFHAIVELAYQLNFVFSPEYERLLTHIGESTHAPEGPVKPVWDKARRQLRFRGRIVRRVRGENVSSNISPILDAFQESDWPPRIVHSIDVSLSTQPLHDAVGALNRGLQEIRFHVDGDYIFWGEC